MLIRMKLGPILLIFALAAAWPYLAARSQDDADSTKPIRELTEAFVHALNQGDIDHALSLFVENCELIDETGTLHRGRDEIKELLVNFGVKFPSARMAIEVESIRFVGPIAIEDGARVTIDSEGNSSVVKYTAVVVQENGAWKIASVRDFPDEVPATPGESLLPLAWLIGEWINEGADGRVSIRYEWSEDGNFILGEFVFSHEGEIVSKSSHRIGWDPLLGKPRSWLFDSDGGFSESVWTAADEGWLLRSSAVLPDGQVGAATLRIMPQDDRRFVLKGTDRVVGGSSEEDYELVVVRRAAISGR